MKWGALVNCVHGSTQELMPSGQYLSKRGKLGIQTLLARSNTHTVILGVIHLEVFRHCLPGVIHLALQSTLLTQVDAHYDVHMAHLAYGAMSKAHSQMISI